jgi:hypothetical protein
MCARSGAKPGGDSRSRPWSRSPLGRGRLTAWCATALPAPSVACALLPDQLLVILKELLLAAGWPSNNCVSELIGSSRSGILLRDRFGAHGGVRRLPRHCPGPTATPTARGSNIALKSGRDASAWGDFVVDALPERGGSKG